MAYIDWRKIKKGSKLVVAHKEHGELKAFVSDFDKGAQTIAVDRYLQAEKRWMQNGPATITPADVVRVVRY